MDGLRRNGYAIPQLCATVALAMLLFAEPGAAQQSTSPRTPRAHAPYILPDGTVQIVTSSRLVGVVHALNELYTRTHPSVRFTVKTGDNYSAMAALTFDRTAFAPLGCEYTRIGLGNNLKIAAEPLGFRIAHATFTPGDGVPALGVIVHLDNPISNLSMAQLSRMFAVGGPSGDITTWGQAGIHGVLAEREIHPIGPLASDYKDSEDPQAGEFISSGQMGGLNMNHRYVGIPQYTAIVERVKEDPAAIAITALNIPLQGVKRVPLKSDAELVPDGPAADIAQKQYAMNRFIYIYLRVGKGAPIDQFAEDYMRVVLSDAGQRVIANESTGYLPLSPGELAQERMRLER